MPTRGWLMLGLRTVFSCSLLLLPSNPAVSRLENTSVTNSCSRPPIVPLLSRVIQIAHKASLIFWTGRTRSRWTHLGGAHMVGRLLPKRAMQVSRGTLKSQIGSWNHSQSLVPELLAQSCRGGRHRTNPCHAHPHDPWPLTQIGRVSIPTAHVSWRKEDKHSLAILSAAEHANSIMGLRLGKSRRTAQDLVDGTLTQGTAWTAGPRERCKTCMTKWNARTLIQCTSPAATALLAPGTAQQFHWKSPLCQQQSTFVWCSRTRPEAFFRSMWPSPFSRIRPCGTQPKFGNIPNTSWSGNNSQPPFDIRHRVPAVCEKPLADSCSQISQLLHGQTHLHTCTWSASQKKRYSRQIINLASVQKWPWGNPNRSPYPKCAFHNKYQFVREAIRDKEQEPSRMLREFQQILPGFLVFGRRRCDPSNEVQFRTRLAVPICLLTKATQPQPVHSSIRCTSSVFDWCSVILPDNQRESWRRCNAGAERSGRGSGSGNRRTQVRQVSVWWLDVMIVQSDLEPSKCWSVQSASHVRLGRKNAAKKCAWECVSVCAPRSDCHSSIVNSKNNQKHIYTICSVSPQQVALVWCSFLCSRRVLGHQMW